MNTNHNNGEDFWDKFLRLVYGVKRNTEIETIIPYSVELFNKAEKTIWIVAGNLGAELWANPSIIEALENASDRGVEIRIIYGDKMDSDNFEIPRLHQEGKIYLYELEFRPRTLYTIVDESHVRVVEPHLSSEPHSSWVRHNTLWLGRQLELDFKELMQQVKTLERI